jgi:hypothetical protein
MRLHRWSAAFMLVVLCSASPASAQGWGREWFERLSGPGPFAGIGLQFPVGCRWDTTGDQKFYWYFQTPEAMADTKGDRGRTGQLGDEPSTRRLCIDFQYTSATNQHSEDTGLIALRALEGRVGFPLEERGLPWWVGAFEPSIAAGAMRFEGSGFSEWRFTLSPEITVKPLKFLRPGQVKVRRPNKRGDWRGVIEVAYGAVLIAPKITNEDLRVPQLAPFEHGWLQRAVWIRVNASELLGLR